jgi:hypothetical protein
MHLFAVGHVLFLIILFSTFSHSSTFVSIPQRKEKGDGVSLSTDLDSFWRLTVFILFIFFVFVLTFLRTCFILYSL